jgi:membrane dipeptidase
MQGFYDVYLHSKKPFVASHSNAAALCRHKRNLSDDMIVKIGERGGVIGVNYYGRFLEDTAENGIYYSRISRIADHIFHMIQVGGMESVGLGSDFDGIDDNLELSDCGGMELLWEELRRRGLSEREAEGVFSRNVLRLYREMLSKREVSYGEIRQSK